MEESKSKFQFQGFVIRKSLIEQTNDTPSESINISFSPVGIVSNSQSTFQLQLGVKIVDENNVLTIDVTCVADFYFEKGIEEKQLNNYFYINAPAILFPYIRAYITTLTSLSGLKPIILPTLNLIGLGKDLAVHTNTID